MVSLNAVNAFNTQDREHYLTEIMDGNDFDLSYVTLTLTPDGRNDFYAPCIQSAAVYPVPIGGVAYSLDDDAFTAVALNRAVSFYGTPYQTLYVGSNGYLTFGSGDSMPVITAEPHFMLPRITAMGTDLAAGTIWVEETADHVAVTYPNAQSNSGGSTL